MRVSFCKAASLLLGGAAILTVIAVVAQNVRHRSGVHTGSVNLALNHIAPNGELFAVNATFWYPKDGVNKDYPVLHLLNGFNVDSYAYNVLLTKLAEKGYLSFSIDYRQPSDYPKTHPPRPGCSNNTVDAVVAGLFNDGWQYLFGPDAPSKPDELASALETAANDSAVLLAHSYGGKVAFDMLFGTCQESLSDSQLLTLDIAVPCQGYEPILNPSTQKSIVRGLVGYEGYESGLQQQFLLPAGTFVTEIASQYSGSLDWLYNNITGDCKSFVQLNNTNHYMCCDYNSSPDSAQTGSCSAIIPGQEAFRIDREAQEESVSLVADITDASIRAALLGNRDSAKYLTEQLPKNARVLKAETNAMCYQN